MLEVRIFAYLGQNRNKTHIYPTWCGNGGYFGEFPKVDRNSRDCTGTIRGVNEMPAKRFIFFAVALIVAGNYTVYVHVLGFYASFRF